MAVGGLGAAGLLVGLPGSAPPAPAPSATAPPPGEPADAAPAEPVIDLAGLQPLRLRQPEAPPEDAYADEPHVVIGRIEIPRIGLDVPLHQGISLTSIDRGPSHWPGTALPGEIGNAVVAGHRVTNSRPFHDVHLLEPGDEMVLTGEHGRFVYRVTETDVVTPDAMHIVDQTAEPTATIFACHPPGSDRYRYVVRFALEGPPVVPVPGAGT